MSIIPTLSTPIAMSLIFNYGYIEGIRAERRRRLKKGGVVV